MRQQRVRTVPYRASGSARDQGTSHRAGRPPHRLCAWLALGKSLRRLNAAELWINGSVHPSCDRQATGWPLRGEVRPCIAVANGPLGKRTRDQTKGKMRWSRLSSLLWRLLDQVVDPRLTEILVEVAGIALGGGEACPFR